jgi:OCT family organic cation transporter-like MFS transporter 4/5
MSLLANDAAVPQEERVTLDEWLRIVGEFGTFQRRHYFCVHVPGWISSAMIVYLMVFINSAPEWQGDGGGIEHGPIPCGSNATAFNLTSPTISVQAEWELYCERGYIASLLDSLFFVGFAFGAITLGSAADTMGRRRAGMVSCFLTSVPTLLSVLSSGPMLFCALRFVAGFGVAGIALCSYVLSSEPIGPSWQAATGVGQAITFAFGGILTAMVASVLPSWRALTLVVGLSPLASLVAFQLSDESPRWKLVKGDVRGAEDVLRKIALCNLPDGASAVDGLKLAEPNDPSTSDDASGSCVLCRPPLVTRTGCMFYVWFASSMVYYGLSLSAGSFGGSLYTNSALSSAVEIPGEALGAWLCTKVGRRTTLLGAYTLGTTACVACAILPAGATSLMAALLGKFAVAAAFAIIYVYTSELMPTVVRSSAMGLCSTGARIGGVLAPAVVLLGASSDAIPQIVFGGAAALAAAAMLPLPETLGRPMPETLADVSNSAPPAPSAAATTSSTASHELPSDGGQQLGGVSVEMGQLHSSLSGSLD